MAVILNITRFQTATYVFLGAENIPKISGQVACFLQKVPTGLYICTFAAALLLPVPKLSIDIKYETETSPFNQNHGSMSITIIYILFIFVT